MPEPRGFDWRRSPRFAALQSLFDSAYLTLPVGASSDDVLRAVMRVARCYETSYRGGDEGEWWVITALACVDPDDFLADLHRDHPGEYHARMYDPLGRQGSAEQLDFGLD
jgi:hypothetical protein